MRSEDLKKKRGTLGENVEASTGDKVALGLIAALPTLLGSAFGGAEGGAIGAETSAKAIESLMGRADAGLKARDAQLETDIAQARQGELEAEKLVNQDLMAGRQFERTKGWESDKLDRTQKFEAGEKERDRQLQRELAAAKNSAKGPSLTPGQKKLDERFTEDLDSWTSGGARTAANEISKLSQVAEKLKNKEVETGFMTGALWDDVTDKNVLAARSDVESTIMMSLKQILGAQFTEKEGQRVIKATWNERDKTENNERRIRRLIDTLTGQAVAKARKANYFAKHGTLVGYEDPESLSVDGLISLIQGADERQGRGGGKQRSSGGSGSARPQTVIQNGVTYTWNPETGTYE